MALTQAQVNAHLRTIVGQHFAGTDAIPSTQIQEAILINRSRA